jgi:hypothetical protein
MKLNSTLILKTVAAGMLVLGTAMSTTTVQAHHSFAAEFDANKTVQMTGIVTKVEWTNPHVWIYFNVKGEDGKMANWGVELGPPHLLQRRGWRRDTLQIGTSIDVDGFLARNGSDRVNARTVTVSGTGGAPGATLDAGSSQLERNNEN